jgi:dTDP-4-dehydrorhamnose reductase
MRILLFGKNGQVGFELQRTLSPLGELIAPDIEGDTNLCGDFTDPDGLRRTIRSLKPDVIVNAAAYTAVDKAESEADLAMMINAEAPRVLAEEAEAIDACLVHYSTDFVFDGKQTQPYKELDQCNPLSEYGRSKLAGDMGIASACSRHLIFRTSWVFGAHRNNFLNTILKLASERTALSVIADQIGTPTGASLIAESTATILAKMANASIKDARWGLYNLVASGQISWHGFASYVVQQASAKGMQLGLSSGAISAIPTEEYPLPAVRPSYSVLNTGKLIETFDLLLPPWEEGVDRVIDSLIGK